MSKDDTEKRMQRLREAKLEAERERDLCLEQLAASHKESRIKSIRLKSIRGRLRLARQALLGKHNKVRNNAFHIATKSIRLAKRNSELNSRVDELINDCTRLQKTIDTFKAAEGIHTCPKCGKDRPVDCFPLEPRFVVGRDFARCRICTSQRVREIHAKKHHRQRHEGDE